MTFTKHLKLTRPLIALTFVAVGFAMPRVATAETLADALVSAYNHSGLLEQNRAVLRAADEDVAIVGATLKPVLSWSAALAQSFGTTSTSLRGAAVTFSTERLSMTISLIGQLLLYDFGASQYRIEAAKETVLATRGTLLNIEQTILLRAVRAYMGVIEASEFVALRKNNQRLVTQELRAARDRFEVGEVTRTDVALAEAQLAQARSGLAGAEGDYLRAVEEFRNAVGRKPGRLSPPPRLPKVDGNVESAKALAVRRHPLMNAAQHQVAAAELLIKAGEADMEPKVSLTGQYGLTENFGSPDYNRTGSVGVELSQTIYGGGRLSAQVRKSMAQRDAQRSNLYVVTLDIRQNVGNAYASLTSARAVLEASERQIRAARIAFRGLREEATLGARTTLEVLTAEQSLLDAESSQVSARSSLYVAAYTVLASTGQLTAQNLKLPVQIYDPVAYYDLVKDGPVKKSKQGRKLDRVLRALQKN